MEWIVILACANGRVGFASKPLSLGNNQWVCMNDGLAFPWPHDAMQNQIAILDSMLAHAVALKGAVNNIFLIPAI